MIQMAGKLNGFLLRSIFTMSIKCCDVILI